KREHIRRGIDAMKRAEAMKPDTMEAMPYHGLLLRQQALLEKDPASQKKLIAEAAALHTRAVEIIKKRRGQ
ncbi:MAG TPA: hypothetical protein VLU46_16095, partial [Thermoanaerobaculia bacterium]|nr:hypothetical protein [Thermoanaerobaculia bacterium]